MKSSGFARFKVIKSFPLPLFTISKSCDLPTIKGKQNMHNIEKILMSSPNTGNLIKFCSILIQSFRFNMVSQTDLHHVSSWCIYVLLCLWGRFVFIIFMVIKNVYFILFLSLFVDSFLFHPIVLPLKKYDVFSK